MTRRTVLAGAGVLALVAIERRFHWATRRVLVRAGLMAPPANLLRNAAFAVTTNPGFPDHWGSDSAPDVGDVSPLLGFPDGASPVPGARVLRITNPKAGFDFRWLAEATFVPDRAPYCLSMWLRSRQAGQRVTLRVGWDTLKTFALTDTWTRFAVTATPRAEVTLRRGLEVELRIPGPGEVEICAPQLEKGVAPTGFAAALVDDHPLPALDWPPDTTWHEAPGGRPFQPAMPVASAIAVTDPNDQALDDIRAHGFDAVTLFIRLTVGENLTGPALARVTDRLDAAHGRGLRVIPFLTYSDHNRIGEAQPAVMDLVARVKSHPALAAWLYVDEPSRLWAQPPWEELAALRAAIACQDPAHPVFLNDNQWPGGEPPALDATDVGCLDVYPIGRFTNGIQAVASLSWRLNRSCAAAGKPTGLWLQLYGHSDAVREPSPAEARAMAWLACIHGTRLVLFWQYRPGGRELWAATRDMTKDIAHLGRLAATWRDHASVGGVVGGSVHYVRWSYANRHCLVLCNISPDGVSMDEGSFGVSGISTVAFARGSGVSIHGRWRGGRSVHIDPFGCGVLEWTAP